MKFFSKMKGTTTSPPSVNNIEVFWSWLGSFIGILVVGYINFKILAGTNSILLIASFGASAVLIYGAPKSPLAQPRNVIGGHVLAAIIGVTGYQLISDQLWICSALVVATSIALMHLTKTLHPPAGATSLIAVIGGDKIHEMGYHYVLMPVAAGISVLILIALIFNNIPKNRRYPEFWL
jgi:CBS-domain-containing membrane protein